MAELRSVEALVDPVQLLDFTDGYRKGWLPDEEIALKLSTLVPVTCENSVQAPCGVKCA
ncbi:hypothetical protein [Streptomyces sp. NPDC001530]|uniref:hypothetical protein n=1 Tax=Streptomyces sp. NPDC001530 TaxID=3364582 RepID=UPI00368E8639